MRIAHTMIRVSSLERSLAFYTGSLGMTLFRQEDYPAGRFTLAFVGYGKDECAGAVVELTWNWDSFDHTLGDAWGHIAIHVEDVVAECARLAALGLKIARPAAPMTYRSPQRTEAEVIAFFDDPDGYRIELVGRCQ